MSPTVARNIRRRIVRYSVTLVATDKVAAMSGYMLVEATCRRKRSWQALLLMDNRCTSPRPGLMTRFVEARCITDTPVRICRTRGENIRCTTMKSWFGRKRIKQQQRLLAGPSITM
ncbi:hypothetical protein SprV_0401406600 [Sparganum proliferum]